MCQVAEMNSTLVSFAIAYDKFILHYVDAKISKVSVLIYINENMVW